MLICDRSPINQGLVIFMAFETVLVFLPIVFSLCIVRDHAHYQGSLMERFIERLPRGLEQSDALLRKKKINHGGKLVPVFKEIN